MKWIQSNGGPLVLVPESLLEAWRGVFADPASGTSHYDLACSVTDDVAVLHVQHAEVLVLGDEPFQTTWIPTDHGGLLLRWVYSDGEQPILDFLEKWDRRENLQPSGVTFYAPGPCVLFDSAEPGTDVRGSALHVPLSAGHYEIMTAMVDPSEDLRLLIHQLALKS